jgi:PAS domain S-box-containing protein
MTLEEKLRKANRLYSFTSRVNQMIVRVKDEETLFKEACKVAVDVGQFRMAWVGMMDAETNRIIPVMYAGVEMDYLSKIKIIYVFEDPEKNGPAATAFKEKRHVVCNDIQHDPLIAPWRDAALERGYYSSIGLPLFKSEEVVGVLSLYSSVTHYFDEAEILLLRETADNISFSMDVFEKERQRKIAEEAVIRSEKKYQALAEILSESEEKYRKAQAMGKMGHWDWNLLTGKLDWSDEMYRIFDVDKNTPGDRHEIFWNALHADDRDEFEKAEKDTIAGRKNNDIVHRIVTGGGAIKYIHHIAESVKDEKGVIIRLTGTLQDITLLERARNEILIEKQLSDSIINSLPGAFYLYNREGLFLRWNHNFESVTGYTAEEIKTMHPLDFFDTADKAIIADKIEEVFKEGQANVEADFLLKYGRKIPYYFTGRAIGYEGKPCLVGVGIDISQRVLAQEQMKETSEQLRQLAAHLQDIREDERAAIAREVHDELGQQLTGLKMDIYWLRDELVAGNNDIIIQIDSILKLTNQIINSVRKIASALRPPILDDLGLEDALRAYCHEFQGRYGVEVECNINLKGVQLSPKISISLFRIFQESLTNVARHAEASKVFVSLSLKQQRAVLSIRDNGKGFDLEDVTKKRTLGLLGMKERVNMLDGKCLIRSHSGGTEIEVIVPLNKVLTS